MLKTLKINNFTVFGEADLQFSPGLNVIVGENGTGKSHLLKLGYAVLRASQEYKPKDSDTEEEYNINFLRFFLHQLDDIFKVDGYEELAQHYHLNYSLVANWGKIYRLELTSTEDGVLFDIILDKEHATKTLFIPPKEIVSIHKGFRSVLENRELDFDKTYLDLANALDMPPFKGKALEDVQDLVTQAEDIINYSVYIDNGSFYFKKKLKETNAKPAVKSTQEKAGLLITKEHLLNGLTAASTPAITAHLMAEGHRKLGMLAYLIKNGSIGAGSSLFWDEPEANLNPKYLKALAEMLVELSNVMQITIATHSLFLLRELEILQEEKKLKNARYFGLHLTDDGVTVQQGDTANDIGDIVALEESLLQSDRYLDATYQD